MRSLKDRSSVRDEVPPEEVEKPSKRMRQSTIYQSDECLIQLKALAAERRTSISAIVGEGLNYVFRKYDKPPIAIDKPER